MAEHLIRRNGAYYYARRVPKALQQKLGKSVIKFSLGTANLKDAKARRSVANVEWDARFDELTRSTSVQSESVSGDAGDRLELIRRYVAQQHVRIEGRLSADPPATEAERRDRAREAEIDLQRLRNLDDPYADERLTAAARQVCAEISADALDGTSSGFAELLRRALVELGRRRIALVRGDHDATFFDSLFDPNRPARVTFAALVEEYLRYKAEDAEAFGYTQKNRDKQAAQARLILELIGAERSVGDIGFTECQDARRLLAQVPANLTKHYPGVPLAKAVQRAAAEGKPTLSHLSQSQYLAALTEILGLAVKKRLLPSNPADSLRPLKRESLSAGEKRVPFSADQLATFFRSEFYADCARGPGPAYRRAEKPWRFWLPLLMALMGLRPREICQLHVSDLKKTESGLWYIDVISTDDEDDERFQKSLKTRASRRQVPVHPELLQIGFVQFVAEHEKADDPRLFWDLKPNKYGDPAMYALRQFRESYLPRAVALQPRQAVYSFRHSWRDAMRRIEAPGDALKALGGWSEGAVTSDHYGSTLQPETYAKYIEAVEYAGLNLSHLYGETAVEAPISKPRIIRARDGAGSKTQEPKRPRRSSPERPTRSHLSQIRSIPESPDDP